MCHHSVNCKVKQQWINNYKRQYVSGYCVYSVYNYTHGLAKEFYATIKLTCQLAHKTWGHFYFFYVVNLRIVFNEFSLDKQNVQMEALGECMGQTSFFRDYGLNLSITICQFLKYNTSWSLKLSCKTSILISHTINCFQASTCSNGWMLDKFCRFWVTYYTEKDIVLCLLSPNLTVE